MVAKFNIDLKYTLLNIVREDLTIDHDKFSDIVNSAINKADYAAKTKQYRKAHEMSKSPSRNYQNSRINASIERDEVMTTCQIQTEFCCPNMDTDSDSDEKALQKFQTLDIKDLSKPKCRSTILKKFEESTVIQNRAKNIFDRYKQKLSLKKKRSVPNQEIHVTSL